jgi:uncharacterized protein
MITSSFCFIRNLTEEQERALWSHGITSWSLARTYVDEVAAVISPGRASRLVEQVAAAQDAVASGDVGWVREHWPVKESWRLWQGWATPEQTACVDIETTGLTAGYDQITVIGMAAGPRTRAFVAGRPQPGDDGLDRFPEAVRGARLLVTFNGVSFDVPFIERHFKDAGFRFEMPHIDLMLLARAGGLSGGLKDIERNLGIGRADEIKEVRGSLAIQLWGRWKSGDVEAYRTLLAYCQADCANLPALADHLYRRRWEQVFASHAKHVDFAKTRGQQLSLFG